MDCWMEIQHGKGPWANPVTGIVPLGTTLTMVVGINDKLGMYVQVELEWICVLCALYEERMFRDTKLKHCQNNDSSSGFRLYLIFHLMKCISILIQILNCFAGLLINFSF